ncbi:MAG: PilZ domain-containing protein [Nitrospirae bacterium]|nr:PilZ domain-containing protein [Nitrospirota bacterium]
MKKIIIARDLLDDLEEGNTIFKRSDITFFPAGSSEDILDLHGVERADLIITEAALPLMGGAKLCSRIRSDAELKYVSIIIIGDETEDSVSQCKEAGANVVIRRPLKPGMLLWQASEQLVIPHRKDMRVLLRASIKGMEGNTPFFAKSENISLSGMLLETDRMLQKGDRLTCSFNIAHSEISLTCMVERVETTASKRNRYGVRFLNCDTKALIIIENFVKAPKVGSSKE